jgi:predicted nucleotidyltransferase
VITAVLGAPGSGKSTIVEPLAACLPTHAVLDWDGLMAPAAALAGREIRPNPETWPAYRELVGAVLRAVAHLPVVLLGVCTPDELQGWPIGIWVLLDCADEERQRRLLAQGRQDDIDTAIADGRAYRLLGLPDIETTGRTPSQVAAALAQFVQHAESGHRQPLVPTLAALVEGHEHILDVREASAQLGRLSGPVGRKLRRRRHDIVTAAAEHGVTNLRVFGSVARGEDRPDSDVDLLADLPPGMSLFGLWQVQAALEAIVGTPVDLVSANGLKPGVASKIANEVVALSPRAAGDDDPVPSL